MTKFSLADSVLSLLCTILPILQPMASAYRRPPIHYREAINADPCGGHLNVGNGCQMVFPRMEPGGHLCFLCAKLQDPDISGVDKDEIRANYVQCGECGVCGTMITDPCGTCRRAANYEAGTTDQDRERGAQRRHLNLVAKMNKSSSNDAHQSVGTTTSVQELQAIRTAQGIGSPSQRAQVAYCTIYYECRRSDSTKHVDQMLGTGVISFPEGQTMLALRSRIVKEVNGRWTEIYSAPLLEEETSLRAPNNFVFPTDSLVMTVAQWYQTYSAPEYRDTYIVLPKHAQRSKSKGNSKLCAFSVELYINVGQYSARTEDPELIGVGKAGSKRKPSGIGSASTPKRPRETKSSQPSTQTLRSSFISDGNILAQTPPTLSVTEIRFKKTTCLVSDDTGTPTLMEESALISGFLETRTLDLSACERGSTKDVFGLQINGRAFVAKRLVNVGSGRWEHIPISQVVNVLTADLVRLKRMAYFAEKFKSLALDEGVDVAEFDVSDGFLVKIYKSAVEDADAMGNGEQPQGERPQDLESASEVAEAYLVEPRRLTSTVVKFSGTLGSTTRSDLRSLTMAAFAHFIAEQTACQYIFADIQGSNNASVGGKLSLTLFDPMTHTVEGTSGVGDHGPKGLQDFVTWHVCNYICTGLHLAPSEVLQNTLDNLLQDVKDPAQDTSSDEEGGEAS